MYFLAFIFLLPGVAIAQNLVLIGGNLKDDNAGIWTMMVEKAVGVLRFKIYNFFPLIIYF